MKKQSCLKEKATTGAKNGSFQKPNKHFTQITNQVLRDETLSLRAKGLYGLIASYITLANFTLYKNYIKAQCSEGRHAFDTAWNELQEAGYLVHQRIRQENGTFGYEYSLVLPEFFPEKTEKQDATEHTTPQETFEQEPQEDRQPKTTKEIHSLVAKQEQKQFSATKVPLPENQTPVYLYIYNKTLQKNTQSVTGLTTGPIKKAQQKITKHLKEQIEYSYFLKEDCISPAQKNTVTFLLDFLVAQTLLCQAGKEDTTFLSQPEIDMVDSCTLYGFLEHIQQRQRGKVYHPGAYWTKAFVNYIKEQNLCLAAV